MANIVISELRPAGAELFDGSESYMHDLTDNDLHATKGGSITVAVIVAFAAGVYVGYKLAQ